jgi:hypothetical protein
MSNSPKTQKRWFFSRAVAGLVLVALAAACNSPTAPSPIPTAPGQNPTETSRNWPDVSGTYTLTLSASSRCASELPEAARTRTFTATIAQTGGALVVTVPMTTWVGWNNQFKGELGETNDVIFQLVSIDDWGLPFGWFYSDGSLTATISAGGLSGFLDGYVAVSPPAGGPDVRCTAPDHSVVFSR